MYNDFHLITVATLTLQSSAYHSITSFHFPIRNMGIPMPTYIFAYFPPNLLYLLYFEDFSPGIEASFPSETSLFEYLQSLIIENCLC